MLADNHMADANTTTAAAVKTTPKHFKILIVDDNHDSALSMAMMLSIMGHDTRTAHDGESAVDTAESFLPEVILLDIGLPKLNGYEVAQRIREKPWGTAMFLIAVTGWGQEEDRQRSSEVGLNVHMVKPVEPAALEKLLAGLPLTERQ
ncbi:MAG: response regulator [Cyanobacteria bacterium]|nr:response regulator [Cyanobacteriota bacterium]